MKSGYMKHILKNIQNIEPSEKQLIDFINKIISKNKKIIITTGK